MTTVVLVDDNIIRSSSAFGFGGSFAEADFMKLCDLRMEGGASLWNSRR